MRSASSDKVPQNLETEPINQLNVTMAPYTKPTAILADTPASPTAPKRRQRSNSCSDSSTSSSEASNKSTIATNRGKRRSQKQRKNWVPFEEQQQYVALDCEMVGVGECGTRSAIARVTIVNWNGKKLYDQFVLPGEEIVDYRTFVSGIHPADLEHAIDLDTCRMQVLEILNNKVLVGHALKNDLHALNIQHPWHMIRDTAKYPAFQKVRFDDGVLWPRKLKELTKELLGRDIQVAGKAHSAYEDAMAALDLYKKVRSKWEKVMDYKIAKTREIEAQRVSE